MIIYENKHQFTVFLLASYSWAQMLRRRNKSQEFPLEQWAEPEVTVLVLLDSFIDWSTLAAVGVDNK